METLNVAPASEDITATYSPFKPEIPSLTSELSPVLATDYLLLTEEIV